MSNSAVKATISILAYLTVTRKSGHGSYALMWILRDPGSYLEQAGPEGGGRPWPAIYKID